LTAHGDATGFANHFSDSNLAVVKHRIANRGDHLSAHSHSRQGGHRASGPEYRYAVVYFSDFGLSRAVGQAGTARSTVGALGCLVCRDVVDPIAFAGIAALAVAWRHRDDP